MRRIGSVSDRTEAWRKPFDPVDALARAILYQQLSGKAAATIVSRVETAIAPARRHPARSARPGNGAPRRPKTPAAGWRCDRSVRTDRTGTLAAR